MVDPKQTLKELEEGIKSLQEETFKFTSIFGTLDNEIKKSVSNTQDLVNNFKKGKDISNALAKEQAKVQEKALYSKAVGTNLEKQISEALANNLDKEAKSLNKKLTKNKAQQKLIEYTLGELDALEKINKEQKTSNNLSNSLNTALSKTFGITKGNIKEMFTLTGLFTFLINAALSANKQSVELGKSLGYGADRADAFRENIAGIARNSENININTQNLVEAFNELATATGFAYEFSTDQLETQVKLTKQVGLTADEAAQVQRFGVLTGKTSEETYKSFVKGLVATRNQLKVGINFKATLAEAVKVSGQLAAQLGYNPERIAKAIVTAKAFGMTLEQVAKSGESLLNFETSIENELKAELLTGKQLNLERARAAALSGDQATVAAEIAANVGTAADFAKMNTLEQKALAEAVGMTADELSNTLIKREEALASGKSLAQITEEEAAQALERQNIQDKFNAAILKLQDFFGNLVAGPLGSFLDILTQSLDAINLILYPFKLIYDFTSLIGNSIGGWLNSLGVAGKILKGIASVAIIYAAYQTYGAVAAGLASTGIGGLLAPIIAGAAAAGVTSAGFGLLNSKKADDMMSEGGYGKRTLLSPEGAIRLNDKDTVIAGTDLGGGSGNISPSIDLTPMIAAINEVKAEISRLVNRPIEINLDGKKVGSGLTQGSYKLA
jgi:hypothetical protein